MEQIIVIAQSVLKSFLAIWPYLLITIPLAVTVQVSGMSSHISSIFNKKPAVSILLATAVGAFSPFCSCGVVPLIASLLIGGVPLAPVMSFWIASPSVDPELIPLGVATIGLDLSMWRLGASLVISLLSGFFTHYATPKGLRGQLPTPSREKDNECKACQVPANAKPSLMKRVWLEMRNSTWLIVKFMGLAFVVTAIIKHYLPQEYLQGFLQMEGGSAVFVAVLVGIPTYTSNLLALPVIGELLDHGMNPGAALAFLLAGPVTTLPAMIAVWGITRRRVFFMYLGFSVSGAVIAGLLLNLLAA